MAITVHSSHFKLYQRENVHAHKPSPHFFVQLLSFTACNIVVITAIDACVVRGYACLQ